MEENLDEIFDLNPFPPEIYSSAAAQHILSFENSNTWNHHHLPPNSDNSNRQIINFSSSSAKINDSGGAARDLTATRTASQAQDHLMAERERRENLRQLFISLSKVVPGLKKLDKASLLEDATTYLKALQERVSILEEQETKRSSIDASISKHDSSPSSSSSYKTSESNNVLLVPEIKARISNRNVLIKIFCKKESGLISRIPCEIEKMHLSVLDMRMMPFGEGAFDITVLAETKSEFRGTVKEIVDQLQMILLNPRNDN